jgi:hypothetical protein
MACNFAALPELQGEELMSNDEIRMTNQCPNDPMTKWKPGVLPPLVKFVIRASSLVIIALSTLSLFWCGCVGPHNASSHPASPHLVGRIFGNSYTSAQGHFSVPFPVSPEVGGCVIRDDAQSVTFHDNWGSKISFYSKPISPQSPMISVPQSEARGKALETFMKDIYGDAIAPHYHPDVLEGTVSFVYLKPVGPKTGVATCIHQQRVYLVETDLLPGVQLLSKEDDASEQARDEWLENRAMELLRSIEIK